MNDDPSADDAALILAGRRALSALPDAPEWRVLQAEAIWRPLPARPASLLARIRAVLSFDSWASPAPALRSAAAPGARQLLFTAEGRDIDLRLASAGDGWVLEGHVLGPGDGGTVELTSADSEPPRVLPLDELGSFRYDGLAAGTVHLRLCFTGEEVELPPVQLGTTTPDG
jgi:hypothetical protein